MAESNDTASISRSDSSNISRAAGIIAFFALLSRIVGLYRDHLLAQHFGLGDLLDSYYVAFRIPDLVFNFLILGTLSVAFIPVFIEHYIKDREEANRVANTVLTVLFIGMGLLCIILFFFVPELTRLTAPGFTGQKFANTVLLTRIFLLSPLLFTVASVFSSVLNALKRFALVSIAPIIYNFGIIFGIIYLYPVYGIRGLGYGVVGGAFAYLIVQMVGAMFVGFKVRPNLDVKHPGVIKITKLFLPRILGVDSSQLSLLIASIIGSVLVSGTISAFNLANNLQAAVVNMFGTSFALAAFPYMSESFAKKDYVQFTHTLTKILIYILIFIIPISILTLMLRAQIVRLAFGSGSGHFNWTDTKVTADMLGIFVFAIFAEAIAPLFSRAFYARHNTIIPVSVGLITLIINGASSYFLGKSFGGVGLVMGFAFGEIFNVLVLFIILHRQLEHLDDKYLFYTLLKILLASAVMAIVTYATINVIGTDLALTTSIRILIQTLIASAVGVAVYAVCAWLLKIEEAKAAFTLVKRKIFR